VSGEDSRTKGKLFEQHVARFLEGRGWKSTLGRPFPGRIALRKHDCDVFVQRLDLGWALMTLTCLVGLGCGLAYWFGLFELHVVGALGIAPVSFLFLWAASRRSVKYVWIECKNLQQSVKRDLIMKLKDQFQDAKKPRGSWECWLVSTSRFDEDAIVHAKAHGVRCYQAVEAGGRNMALHRVESKTGDL
jgi:hypothetical protein